MCVPSCVPKEVLDRPQKEALVSIDMDARWQAELHIDDAMFRDRVRDQLHQIGEASCGVEALTLKLEVIGLDTIQELGDEQVERVELTRHRLNSFDAFLLG